MPATSENIEGKVVPTGTARSVAAVSLAQLQRGRSAVLDCTTLADADAELLRAMGFRSSTKVRLCRFGSPCIVELTHGCGSRCRVGLARDLAERISVCEAG